MGNKVIDVSDEDVSKAREALDKQNPKKAAAAKKTAAKQSSK